VTANPADLTSSRDDPFGRQPIEAVVYEAPASRTALLSVTIPSFDTAQVWTDTDLDSVEDRKARAAIVCSIRRGSMVYEPTVGITPLPFQTRGVDTARLASEIQQSDPGLEITATEAMDALDHTHRYVHTAVAPAVEGS
jgi:hypothetical protein